MPCNGTAGLLQEETGMRSLIWRVARDELGSNALEYGLIVGLISLAIVAGATAAGTALGGLFNTIAGQITNITI
jgi:pilus assembly protein Flp/PilA